MKIEDLLQEKEVCVISPKGGSMLPLIRPELDTVLIRRASGSIRRGDIVLYHNSRGYVLHRVLDDLGELLLICGDNQTQPEYVEKSAVIAVVEGLYRKERLLSVRHPALRMYAAFWGNHPQLRKPVLWFRRNLRRMKSRFCTC